MQQRSETTRAHILASAQSLFAQNGYDATGVAEICKAAGVSKGAFYHHFATKQAVFLQLLENWLGDLEPRLVAFTRGSDNMAEALVEMSSLVREIFASGQGQLPMFLEFWIQASRDPTIWQTTIAPYHRYQEIFAGILQKGIEQGAIQGIDAQAASRVVMALAMGLILQGLFDPQGAHWEEVAQQGMQVLMQGMSGRAA